MSDRPHEGPGGARSDPPVDIEGKMILDSVEARLFGGRADPTRIGAHEVLRRLGAGGMGEVYLAFNPELRRLEAVKILRTGHGGDAKARDRLLREAHALARLSHPNVVTVYRSDVAGGDVYIAMEFIEGPTLESWQRQAKRSWREILQVYTAAGRGLAAAHRAGLVHRDFKPSNVLLGKEDPAARGDALARRVRVIDFGLAVDDADSPAASATDVVAAGVRRTTALVGTPYYLSPEQCDECRPPLTPASDQFSFCVALYEALYHQHPFFSPERVKSGSQAPTPGTSPQPGTNPPPLAALIDAIREARLRPDPDLGVPRRLFEILRRGLARDPGARHESMDALLPALERELQPRHAARLAIVGGAGVLLGAAAIAFSRQTIPEQCSDPGAAIADVWSPDRAAAVERALAVNPASAPFAAASARAVDRDLSAYAAEWTRVLARACADTYRSGTLDEAVYHRRIQCLDARKAALADAADALITTADTHRRVDAVIAALPPVGDCEAIAATRCDDPAHLERFTAVRDTLARARADERAGHYDEAARSAAQAQRFAVDLDHAPLIAASAFVHGRLLAELSRWDEAEAALTTGFTAAERAGCDDLAIDIANRLAKSVALNPDPDRPASDWSPVVFARLGRTQGAADDLHLPALTLLRKAEAYNNRGLMRQRKLKDPACAGTGAASCPPDLQGALDDFRAALRLREGVKPAPLSDLSNNHRNLGAVLSMMNRADQGLDHFGRGLELAREAFGEGNPSLWKAHFDLGKALADLGRNDESEPHLREALRLVELGHDAGNLKIGEAHLELAKYHDNVGASAEAKVHAEAAARIFAPLSASHPRRFSALRMLGWLYQVTGAYEEALVVREQLLTATRRDDLEELAVSHIELAETLGDLERWPEALRHADLARDLVDTLALPPDDVFRGEVGLHRGLALRATGQPGAVDVLRDAEKILREKFADGVIDPALWAHAAWEVTAATCGEPPAGLEDALAAATPDGRPPTPLVRRLRDALTHHDRAACARRAQPTDPARTPP